MLVRLFGKNFRSLRDPFELSMVAADLKRDEDRDRGSVEINLNGAKEPIRLLRAAAIFGSNASGKSTVLIAGHALSWLVVSSSQQPDPDTDIPPYEPFQLDDNTRTAPIELGCDVLFGNSILRYEVTYDTKTIRAERLLQLDGVRTVNLIDRDEFGKVGGKLIEISPANQLYVHEIRPNVTVLAKLAQHGPHKGKESAQPYFRVIRNALRHSDYCDASEMRVKSPGDDRFADDNSYREWIMTKLIRAADLGIAEVQTRREALEIPEFVKEELSKRESGFKVPDRVVVAFRHLGKSSQLVDFSAESAGTRKLFNISHDWWRLANESITLLADELGASLHPTLLDKLIRGVNGSTKDQVRSQLIFTSHDTGLLEGRDGLPAALRRDQVYFTKKSSDGASELYSLTEFKDEARPVHNIRKRYLAGIYGAVPSVEKLAL